MKATAPRHVTPEVVRTWVYRGTRYADVRFACGHVEHHAYPYGASMSNREILRASEAVITCPMAYRVCRDCQP